jgi:hypothetical protein
MDLSHSGQSRDAEGRHRAAHPSPGTWVGAHTFATLSGDSRGSTRQAHRAAIAFHRRSGQTFGPMIHGERKGQPLLTTPVKLDAPDRLAVALDPEVRDRFDRPEPQCPK